MSSKKPQDWKANADSEQGRREKKVKCWADQDQTRKQKKAVGRLLFELNQERRDVAHKTIAWKLRPMMQRVRPEQMRC